MYDKKWYLNQIFKDKHIMNILNLTKQEELKEYLEKHSTIITTYWDIMPEKIKKSFHIDFNLYQSLNDLLNFIQKNLYQRCLTPLFWNEDKPKKESEIQEVLICLFNAYFYNNDIDINRESLVGTGKIDFKFYRHQDEKIIFEIKKASNKNLKFGYESQLKDYIKAYNCKHAYYIILCFNDSEIKIAQKLLKEESHTYDYSINIIFFDLRKKDTTIPLCNESIYYKNIPNKINKYFKYIPKIEKLNKSDEFTNYLENLLTNFQDIENKELKQSYIKKIHEYTSSNKESDFYKIDIFNPNDFFIIYTKDSLKHLVLNLLNDIICENDLLNKIPEILDLLKTLDTKEYNECITEEEIKEIFEFLKKEKTLFYKIIRKKKLRIYLLNETSSEFNSSVIPTLDNNSYSILCSNMQLKEQKGYSIYVFFFCLGIIFNWSVTKKYGIIPQSFLDTMQPLTKNLKPNKKRANTLFAESFAMYLIHNTKYDKYNPYRNIDKTIYQKLQIYFDNLLKEVTNNDYMYM